MPETGVILRGIRAALACMRWLSPAIASAILACAPAHARQDEQTFAMRVLLKALQTEVTEGAQRDFSAPALIQGAGLGSIVAPKSLRPAEAEPFAALSLQAAMVPEPAAGQKLNLRLALTMLAQAYGADDHFGVIAAQTSPGLNALVLRDGRATMADLRRLLRENRLQETTNDGALLLKVPLVIWSGATLDLGPQDQLDLSRADGAFVANFGHLNLKGSTITSAGAANPASPSFMPFVITADGGTVQATGARISSLGFGSTQKFSGFSIMRGILHVADRQNRIEASLFEDLVGLATSGTADILIEGNQFRNMRGSALTLAHTQHATVRSNLFSGKMPTNAIRLEAGSTDGLIEGNVVLGGKHAGIIVRGDSTRARVTRNIVWHRDGGGISLLQSNCGQISENMLIDNRQKGIEVRISLETRVDRNTVLSNQNAGIWVAGQPKGAQTYVSNNILAANGSGIAGAIGESIHLTRNDFSRQFPQFLSGDLTAQFAVVARDLHGQKPAVLLAADSVRHTPKTVMCSDQG